MKWFKLVLNVIVTCQQDVTTPRAWLYVSLHQGIAVKLQTSGCCDDKLAGLAQPASEGKFEVA